MSKGLVLLSLLAALGLGAYAGFNLNGGARYQDGRVSACKEVLKGMEQALPFIAIAQVTCVPYNGDAAIKVGDNLFSLDATKKLK